MIMKVKVISAVVISVLAIVSLTAHILLTNIQYDNPIALFYRDGELVHIIPLSEDYNGIITVRDGKIAITESDCHNQICVNMGFVSGIIPIICVPNPIGWKSAL
jgi:hypothetical protein